MKTDKEVIQTILTTAVVMAVATVFVSVLPKWMLVGVGATVLVLYLLLWLLAVQKISAGLILRLFVALAGGIWLLVITPPMLLMFLAGLVMGGYMFLRFCCDGKSQMMACLYVTAISLTVGVLVLFSHPLSQICAVIVLGMVSSVVIMPIVRVIVDTFKLYDEGKV